MLEIQKISISIPFFLDLKTKALYTNVPERIEGREAAMVEN
jgi:hypothetical protein